jgi:hypothetical protein
MPAIQRISDRMTLADVVALDRDGKPVVVVAAEERPIYPVVIQSYLEVLSAIRRDIPFAILAFADEMTIYRKRRTRPLELLAKLPTREVIRFYSPQFADGPLSKWYIAAKLRDWLEDFMRRSPDPPYWETIERLGLEQRLWGGWTKERVRLACLPVRGDQLPPELRDREELGSGSDPIEAPPVAPAGPAQHLPDGGPVGP